MDNFNVLPSNWKTKAVLSDASASRRWLSLGEGVWVDDDCPAELSIIVIQGAKVYRITDSADTLLVLQALNFSPVIADLYAKTKIPKIGKADIPIN